MSTLSAGSPSVERTVDCWEGTVAVASAAWNSTVEGLQTAGTWIVNGTSYTVAWLADAFQWLGEKSVDAGIWLRDYVGIPIRDTAIAIFNYICELAVKIYEAVAPFVQDIAAKIRDGAVSGYQFIEKTIQENPNATIVTLSALVAGATLALLIDRLYCR